MKIHLVCVVLCMFFGNVFADSIMSEDDIIANIPLKDNQVLLFDSRQEKPVGIIEVTPSGKIIKIPLPKNPKNPSQKPNSNPKQNNNPVQPSTPTQNNTPTQPTTPAQNNPLKQSPALAQPSTAKQNANPAQSPAPSTTNPPNPQNTPNLTSTPNAPKVDLPLAPSAQTTPPKEPKSQEPLINKDKQWDKKKIPYLIKEETIPSDSK